MRTNTTVALRPQLGEQTVRWHQITRTTSRSAFLVSFHTNSEATSFTLCLGTKVTEVYLTTTTPIRHPHLPCTTPRPCGDGAGRLMEVRCSVLRALQRLGIYARPRSVCRTLLLPQDRFPHQRLSASPTKAPIPAGDTAQGAAGNLLHIRFCLSAEEKRPQDAQGFPWILEVPLPPAPCLLQETRGTSQAAFPQDGPGFQGLERVLLAQCRPRLFNSSWHASCTRWKTVNTDPGAAQGCARGSSRSDKICLARILQAEKHGVLLI